jgi:hypothetical protein
MQPAPQDIQLTPKRGVLSLKPYLRLERRGQDGQDETEKPGHSASLGDSVMASTRIKFSVPTGGPFRPMTPAPGLLGQVLCRLFFHPDERLEPVAIDQPLTAGDILTIAGGIEVIHFPFSGSLDISHKTRILRKKEVEDAYFFLSRSPAAVR